MGTQETCPYLKTMAPEPISPYGASKVAGEALVSSYKSRIKNCLTLRFFNVYGEGQNPEYAGVIIKFIDRLSNQLPPLIYGDGQQTRDFISVNDLVNAIILADGESRKFRKLLCKYEHIQHRNRFKD